MFKLLSGQIDVIVYMTPVKFITVRICLIRKETRRCQSVTVILKRANKEKKNKKKTLRKVTVG